MKFQLNKLVCALVAIALPSMSNAEKIIAYPDHTGKLHWLTNNTDVALPKLNPTILITAPLPLEYVKAGGIGGNEKSGWIYYDDTTAAGHAAALQILRNPLTNTCYLQSADVVIRDWNKDLDVASFACEKPDPAHNNLYWKNSFDMTNGAYNPALDAFAIATAASKMYQTYFAQAIWSQYGKNGITPIQVFIHARRNAFDSGGMFNDGSKPYFISVSDGDAGSFPFTTIDMLGNSIAQGSALGHWGYAWGLGDEPSIAQSYSDIFSKVIENFMTGKVTWSLGADTIRGWGAYHIRYMDKPTKDCSGGINTPGVSCSLETYTQIKTFRYAQANYGAGLLNKVFYLLATSPGWDIEQAFKLLNHSTYYWLGNDSAPDSNGPMRLDFKKMFCSLLTSAQELNISAAKIDMINSALTQVEFDPTVCTPTNA